MKKIVRVLAVLLTMAFFLSIFGMRRLRPYWGGLNLSNVESNRQWNFNINGKKGDFDFNLFGDKEVHPGAYGEKSFTFTSGGSGFDINYAVLLNIEDFLIDTDEKTEGIQPFPIILKISAIKDGIDITDSLVKEGYREYFAALDISSTDKDANGYFQVLKEDNFLKGSRETIKIKTEWQYNTSFLVEESKNTNIEVGENIADYEREAKADIEMKNAIYEATLDSISIYETEHGKTKTNWTCKSCNKSQKQHNKEYNDKVKEADEIRKEIADHIWVKYNSYDERVMNKAKEIDFRIGAKYKVNAVQITKKGAVALAEK